jgi:hypothetical protein
MKEKKTSEVVKYLLKPTMKFEKWGHMERVPFIIYADIECMIRDILDEYWSGRNVGETSSWEMCCRCAEKLLAHEIFYKNSKI